jgi:hypothetical protein
LGDAWAARFDQLSSKLRDAAEPHSDPEAATRGDHWYSSVAHPGLAVDGRHSHL